MISCCAIYRYNPKNCFLIPTQVKTEAGFYLEQDPVKIVPTDDIPALAIALRERLSTALRVVPTPGRDDYGPISKQPTVRAAKARSYNDFVRNVLLCNITQSADLSFEIESMVSPPGKNYFLTDTVLRLRSGMSFLELAERCIRYFDRAQQQD